MEFEIICTILGGIVLLLTGVRMYFLKPGKQQPRLTVSDGRAGKEQELMSLQRKLWEIEKSRVYVDFLNSIMESLQILIGLKDSGNELTEDQKKEIYGEYVADKLRQSLHNFQAQLRQGVIDLPEGKETPHWEKIRNEISLLSENELSEYMERDRRKVSSGKITLTEKKITQELGGVTRRILEDASPGFPEIKSYAMEVKEILEKNGIYPLYAADVRLTDYPKLRTRFLDSGGALVKYPGLFIINHGQYQVFGAYVGIR